MKASGNAGASMNPPRSLTDPFAGGITAEVLRLFGDADPEGAADILTNIDRHEALTATMIAMIDRMRRTAAEALEAGADRAEVQRLGAESEVLQDAAKVLEHMHRLRAMAIADGFESMASYLEEAIERTARARSRLEAVIG